VTLYIDTREKSNSLIRKLKSEIQCEINTLTAGDFWIPKNDNIIVIERSTYTDFAGKIISGRLWEQVDKCLQVSDDVYFLLVNPYLMRYTKMDYRALIAAQTALSRKVKVFTVRNDTESFIFLKKLYDKYNSDRKIEPSEIRAKPKEMTEREQAKYCLMGISGVGSTYADKLLEGRSLIDIVTMEEDKLIDLTNEKLGNRLYGVFRAK